ncbi:putative membrane protein [Methanococcus maripaludis]|uniref:Putative membrane protein n=1 Tax=Methanococcus maripaludis TaxID=39152 RepID=A0A7J9NY84_METMI|nr:hypothetical protein [Methanococcus maripaludis]MBA2852668.1 putative membrane protein [Methanococcus maripaludis]
MATKTDFTRLVGELERFLGLKYINSRDFESFLRKEGVLDIWEYYLREKDVKPEWFPKNEHPKYNSFEKLMEYFLVYDRDKCSFSEVIKRLLKDYIHWNSQNKNEKLDFTRIFEEMEPVYTEKEFNLVKKEIEKLSNKYSSTQIADKSIEISDPVIMENKPSATKKSNGLNIPTKINNSHLEVKYEPVYPNKDNKSNLELKKDKFSLIGFLLSQTTFGIKMPLGFAIILFVIILGILGIVAYKLWNDWAACIELLKLVKS